MLSRKKEKKKEREKIKDGQNSITKMTEEKDKNYLFKNNFKQISNKYMTC